jgi:hypothetical protein
MMRRSLFIEGRDVPVPAGRWQAVNGGLQLDNPSAFPKYF